MKLNILTTLIAVALLSAGCAFDISHVTQEPATFMSDPAQPTGFTLGQDVKAKLGTGFATRLKRGTRWRQVGMTQYGRVFATKDQIVTVEASNIYEADLVVSNQFITGFFLVVEKTFAPVSRPIHIEMQSSNLNQKTQL